MDELFDRGVVQFNRVIQDGARVRAHAKAVSFQRRDRLTRLLTKASEQIERLKPKLYSDPAATHRRQQAAQERAARERCARLPWALASLCELDKVSKKKGSAAKHVRGCA